MELTSPCKDCDSRQVGCHGSCEEYIEYLAKRRAEWEQIQTEKDKDRWLDSYEVRRAERFRRAH